MAAASDRPARRLLADLTPLRVNPAYRRMWFGLSLSGIGAQLTTVAVGLQVYDLTRSTFKVGLVGLFALVPLIAAGLYGGSVIDALDRRRVIITTASGILLCAVAFTVQAVAHVDHVWLLYGLVSVQNVFYPVNSSARATITPRLIGRELLPAANALNSVSMGVSFTLGPLLAGLLVAWVGFGGAYAVEAVLLVFALTTLVALPSLPPEGEVSRSGIRSVLEGFAYLGTRPNVRMTFLVDIAAMALAMPRVLFPALAATRLGGGATTVGILSAGVAVGTTLAGLFSGPLGHVRRQGVAVLMSVLAWGALIALFGVVVAASPGPDADGGMRWWIWPAAFVLACAGAADAVSGVFRNTILQTATPDAMRGRLQGVFFVVVAGGPRLGDLLLGAVADVSAETVAAIAGGLACVVVVLLLARFQPGFARYDAADPTP
ncbi:MFS transporter [Spongisporangium articulatum]|uniref:MFS transporter n=1 Tax=Spongisporangium articulatum TaxID=3362603 RepID=A0ABW8AL95_9ACTN